MKRLPIIAAVAALAVGVGVAAISSSFTGLAQEDGAEPAVPPVPVLKGLKADSSANESPADDQASGEQANKEEDETMSDEATAENTPEEAEAFRQTMHEGDVALGVCGARVSTLLWFYEASVAQGRDDLKAATESLKESREAIKTEAERRAVEDKVDTSVRVMNAESEKMWEELNEKAAGDAEEFQAAHDELFAGVQECLALFFERPGDNAEEEKKEG